MKAYAILTPILLSLILLGCPSDLDFNNTPTDSVDSNESDTEDVGDTEVEQDNPTETNDTDVLDSREEDPLPEATETFEVEAEAEVDQDKLEDICETESCNGLDDDCDGVPDGSEGLIRQCGITDAGECTFGTETCTDQGTWEGCDAVFPETETCNSLDDNCSGAIDDINSVPCLESESACGPGTTECSDSVEVCSSDFGGSEFSGQVIECGQTMGGTTIGGENNRQYYNEIVDPYDGTEAVYVFETDVDMNVQVNITEMGDDLDLFILRTCDGNFFAGGVDGGYNDSWEFQAVSGVRYYLTLDGLFGRQANFTIGVICTPR